jgi:hypothetical protein
LKQEYKSRVTVNLSADTVRVLRTIRYLPESWLASDGALVIAIPDDNAGFIRNYIREAAGTLNIQAVSMAIQKAHEIYREPVVGQGAMEKSRL